VDDWQWLADTLKRERGIIARHVFCFSKEKAGKRITDSGFNKAWRKARIDAGLLLSSRGGN
jgi:hypothetical protein